MLRKAFFEIEFEDTFEADVLDRDRWLPYYLPHWSSRQRSAARYELDGGVLRLVIEADQEPWCPALDGDVRVSSLQTGAFAGPVGSAIGQHRFHPDAVVREAQPNIRLYTPLLGRIEMRARFSADPRTMGALWMIGYEDAPEQSAEICVCEVFGRDVGPNEVAIGVGIHPFDDPALTDDFARAVVQIDASEFHVYATDWTPRGVTFLVDGEVVKEVDQSPTYPMQLMLGLYELPAEAGDPPGTYPKELVVDWVRGYRLVN